MYVDGGGCVAGRRHVKPSPTWPRWAVLPSASFLLNPHCSPGAYFAFRVFIKPFAASLLRAVLNRLLFLQFCFWGLFLLRMRIGEGGGEQLALMGSQLDICPGV